LDLRAAEAVIPRELGIRLSSVFMFDRLVFVEGDTDETILRELSALLGVNLSSANVGFIPIEGARNLAHYAADATLSFLTKRQVRMWFLLDRDEKDEIDIKKLAGRLGSRAKLVVLQRREIENYLLCPRAIAEFIGYKRALGALGRVVDIPSEDDVHNSLLKRVENLKQLRYSNEFQRFCVVRFSPTLDECLVMMGKTLIPRRLNRNWREWLRIYKREGERWRTFSGRSRNR
jgi:putative ATP-dependent endonuclease of the OLD family